MFFSCAYQWLIALADLVVSSLSVTIIHNNSIFFFLAGSNHENVGPSKYC